MLHDLPSFILVTIVGILVISFIIVAFTTYLRPVIGLNKGAWLNIGKIIATIVGAVADFLGYKYIVFRMVKSKDAAVAVAH